MTRVIGFVGGSGSGKTTLICALVRALVSRGEMVAVLKHTHHHIAALASANRGDTLRFIEAGAAAATLIDASRSRTWTADGSASEGSANVVELIRASAASTILIEGYKQQRSWPRVLVGDADGLDVGECIAQVTSDGAASSGVPLFGRDDVEALLAFLDTIAAS